MAWRRQPHFSFTGGLGKKKKGKKKSSKRQLGPGTMTRGVRRTPPPPGEPPPAFAPPPPSPLRSKTMPRPRPTPPPPNMTVSIPVPSNPAAAAATAAAAASSPPPAATLPAAAAAAAAARLLVLWSRDARRTSDCSRCDRRVKASTNTLRRAFLSPPPPPLPAVCPAARACSGAQRSAHARRDVQVRAMAGCVL